MNHAALMALHAWNHAHRAEPRELAPGQGRVEDAGMRCWHACAPRSLGLQTLAVEVHRVPQGLSYI